MKGFRLLLVTYVFCAMGCRIQNSSNGLELELKAPSTGAGDENFDFSRGTIGLEDLKKSALVTCLKCHSRQQAPDLNTLTDWRENQEAVLSEIESGYMPPRDEGFSQLSSCEVALIKKWFDLGAPENSDVPFVSIDECAKK